MLGQTKHGCGCDRLPLGACHTKREQGNQGTASCSLQTLQVNYTKQVNLQSKHIMKAATEIKKRLWAQFAREPAQKRDMKGMATKFLGVLPSHYFNNGMFLLFVFSYVV